LQLDATPFAAEMGREAPAISPEALDVLAAYPFPGNVRELKNIVARALRESRDGTIEPGQLHLLSGEVPAPTTDPEVEIPLDLDEAEVWLVQTRQRPIRGQYFGSRAVAGYQSHADLPGPGSGRRATL